MGPSFIFFELGWAGFLPWVFPCARAFAPQRKPARVSLQPSRGPHVVVPHACHPSPCASRRAQNARASPGAGRAPSGSLMSRPDCVPPFTGLKKKGGWSRAGQGRQQPGTPAATQVPRGNGRAVCRRAKHHRVGGTLLSATMAAPELGTTPLGRPAVATRIFAEGPLCKCAELSCAKLHSREASAYY